MPRHGVSCIEFTLAGRPSYLSPHHVWRLVPRVYNRSVCKLCGKVRKTKWWRN